MRAEMGNALHALHSLPLSLVLLSATGSALAVCELWGVWGQARPPLPFLILPPATGTDEGLWFLTISGRVADE